MTLSKRMRRGAIAAEWGNALIKRLNDRLRPKSIQAAQPTFSCLQQEVLATPVVSLQQSIGQVLEGQMQKTAPARANEDFASTVVDTSASLKYRIYPTPLFVIAVAALLGFIAALTHLVATGALQSPAEP